MSGGCGWKAREIPFVEKHAALEALLFPLGSVVVVDAYMAELIKD